MGAAMIVLRSSTMQHKYGVKTTGTFWNNITTKFDTYALYYRYHTSTATGSANSTMTNEIAVCEYGLSSVFCYMMYSQYDEEIHNEVKRIGRGKESAANSPSRALFCSQHQGS